jgi:hypothetical protein
MLDEKRLLAAKMEGVAFICRMCVRWYQGEDMNLRDARGDKMCAATSDCGSPISGDSFQSYSGPLDGSLGKFCYVCGKKNPEHALSCNVDNASRIGCCKECLEGTVKKMALQNVVFKPQMATDKFEVIQ